MPREVPIACSLDPGALTARKAALARLGKESLLRMTVDGETFELEFRSEAEPALRAVVVAEQRCCAFLSFTLRTREDVVALSIGGPPQAGEIVAELAEAFAGTATTGIGSNDDQGDDDALRVQGVI